MELILQEDILIFERLAVQLDDLISHGRGDSDEADAIRDQMDGPWRRLPTEQIKAIYARRMTPAVEQSLRERHPAPLPLPNLKKEAP